MKKKKIINSNFEGFNLYVLYLDVINIVVRRLGGKHRIKERVQRVKNVQQVKKCSTGQKYLTSHDVFCIFYQ